MILHLSFIIILKKREKNGVKFCSSAKDNLFTPENVKNTLTVQILFYIALFAEI